MSRKENLGDYALTWCDEFNGDKLDTTQWEPRSNTKYWSLAKPENVTVSGGHLHLALKKEKVGKIEYTGGGVVSKRSFRYGYYEASIKLPSAVGWHTQFLLTAFRTEVTGARQEIDMFDADSIDGRHFTFNLQISKPAHRIFGPKHVKTNDLAQDFHVWGCEFTPLKARYFFDGDLVGTMDTNEFIHDDQSIWLSTFAAPLAKTMHVDDATLPAEVLVDWVRFYELKK